MDSANAGLSTNRFARWPRIPAFLALVLLVVFVALAASTPITHTSGAAKPAVIPALADAGEVRTRPRDDDLALYDVAIARIRNGENYYDFIAEEHRKAQYPLRPAVAVRLPTLAYLCAWAGGTGQVLASFALLFAVMAAWWKRLGEEAGSKALRVPAMALLMFGAELGTARYYFTLHELWAGMLLALSFGLHRPGQWKAALAVAALALAIREHALPFVLLMGAMALWRRDWREGAAWSALVAAFLAALAIHMHLVNAMVLPTDGHSAPWLVLRGLTGLTSDIVLSSNLRYLPGWLAGPLVILSIFGWAGWKTPTGAFGALLYMGYGLMFMLAGRPDNFYWGFMVAPAMFMGLAFAPRAIKSLLTALRAS